MARVSGPAVVVRAANGTPFFETKWRDAGGAQVKRRLGPRGSNLPTVAAGADAEAACSTTGWTSARPTSRPAEKVEEVARECEAVVAAAARAAVPTFRVLAAQWLAWKRDVKGGAPSTLEHNAVMLREPGTPHRRGSSVAKGRIIAASAIGRTTRSRPSR